MEFFDKLKNGLSKTSRQISAVIAEFTGADDEFFDSLEESLILADVGAQLSADIIEQLRNEVKKEGLRGPEEIRNTLTGILGERLKVAVDTPPASGNTTVILVIGVNGVGKTTTIGKLAALYKAQGKKVLLCAADTFRAAAGEQLSLWAERTGAEIIRREEGADPASVIFDAINAARSRGSDVVICDTAGRLHNKTNLMNELSKIYRIIAREMPDAKKETLLVLDAATGQNGLIQAEQFKESADITGIVLTKLDGTAKGGIVFAISDKLEIPIKYIGIGEKQEDLVDFDPQEFSKALLL